MQRGRGIQIDGRRAAFAGSWTDCDGSGWLFVELAPERPTKGRGWSRTYEFATLSFPPRRDYQQTLFPRDDA